MKKKQTRGNFRIGVLDVSFKFHLSIHPIRCSIYNSYFFSYVSCKVLLEMLEFAEYLQQIVNHKKFISFLIGKYYTSDESG